MATAFAVRIAGGEGSYARQAAQECFALVDRLEGLLSRFQETSEVACIARLQPGESFRVSAETFDCLQLALAMHTLTGGAFDPTWGDVADRLRGGDGATPSAPRGRLALDPAAFTVEVQQGTVALDLGAIGKGFALDRMAALLREWEIFNALLVSGGSSILALGQPPAAAGWEISVDEKPAQVVSLRNHSIGSSGTSVKGDHIIDPLTQEPARRAHRAWALSDSAAVSDALSTAWMSLTREEIAEVCRLRPGTGAILQPGTRTDEPLIYLGTATRPDREFFY